jgi:hypothetical protein
MRTAVKLCLHLLRLHLLGPLLRGIYGERTGALATRKDRGGAAHDDTGGRRPLLRRLEAMGMPPSLSRLSPPSTCDQIDGTTAELLILMVASAEGGQAPRKRTWVGPWWHPSRHYRGGLLEAEARCHGARAEAAMREKHRRGQAFGRKEMCARSSFWRRGDGGVRYPRGRGI